MPRIEAGSPSQGVASSRATTQKNRAGAAFEEWWAQFRRKDLSPELIAWYAWVAAIMWAAPRAKAPWE
jgi:hypothetical protein